MMRMTSMLGLLLGLASQAQAVPLIDCTDGGFLVDADLGLIAMDDDVVAIAREVERYPGAVSPEDFCAEHGDLVAFILPVPKINPGAPPLDPDLPDPSVQPGFGGPDVTMGTAGGGFTMTPGAKGRPQDDAPDDLAPAEVEEAPIDLDDAPAPGPSADEPAPSPSRAAYAEPATTIGGSGGCAAAPGGSEPAGFLGLLALAFLAARRKGVAR